MEYTISPASPSSPSTAWTTVTTMLISLSSLTSAKYVNLSNRGALSFTSDTVTLTKAVEDWGMGYPWSLAVTINEYPSGFVSRSTLLTMLITPKITEKSSQNMVSINCSYDYWSRGYNSGAITTFSWWKFTRKFWVKKTSFDDGCNFTSFRARKCFRNLSWLSVGIPPMNKSMTNQKKGN